MMTLVQDIRCGLRMLAKSPGFTLVAVLTLALGIAVNTAVFSVINGVLLNSLPYAHPEQLVTLHESKANFATGSIPFPNFLDWQRENHTFLAMAITRGIDLTLSDLGEAEREHVQLVSSDLFSLLGVKPLLGRTFVEGEDRIGAAPVALISEGMWRSKFASSPGVVGKSLTLDGRDYTIVGVIPSTFDLEVQGFFRPRDLYVPIGQWRNNLLTSRLAGLGFHGIGRLKPGVSLAQAQADMDRVTRNLAVAYPDADKGTGASLIPLQQSMTGRVRPILWVLLGAVAFVLLIACVNVANLLLARSAAREREFALRRALGASRGRLLRQLLTESLLLAIGGGALGLLLASWGTQAAVRALPAALPRAGNVHLDSHVLLFTLAVSLFAGVSFGLVPALRSSQLDVYSALKEGARGATGRRYRAQTALVISEMAMALVLLIGAGLLMRSFAALWSVNPGFDPHHVLTFDAAMPPSMLSASPQAIRAYLRSVEDKVTSTPGVEAESLLWAAFPMSSDDEQLFWLAGQPKPASQNDMKWALRYIVGPDYLRAMAIPLERGRFFTIHDDEHSPAVAVVDDVFARKFFGNENPVGKRLNLEEGRQVEIVGVVGHVKQWGLDRDDNNELRTQFYMPFMQMNDAAMALTPGGYSMVVRTRGAELPLYDAIRRNLQSMNRENVIYDPESMSEIISGSLAARRFSLSVLAAFAGLALLLASIGIYGVISYLVGQRTQEIGVRMALGAARHDILRLILNRGGKLALVGTAVGLGAALALTRLMASMLYGVSATDPLTFAAVALFLTFVALAACYIPARRATKVDPMVALRYE